MSSQGTCGLRPILELWAQRWEEFRGGCFCEGVITRGFLCLPVTQSLMPPPEAENRGLKKGREVLTKGH